MAPRRRRVPITSSVRRRGRAGRGTGPRAARGRGRCRRRRRPGHAGQDRDRGVPYDSRSPPTSGGPGRTPRVHGLSPSGCTTVNRRTPRRTPRRSGAVQGHHLPGAPAARPRGHGRGEDLERLPSVVRRRRGPRRHSRTSCGSPRRLRPVDPPVLFFQHRRVRRQPVVLRRPGKGAGAQLRQRLHERLRARTESRSYSVPALSPSRSASPAREHRPVSIPSSIRMIVIPVTVSRAPPPVDRRGAAVPRQQGGVDVDGSDAGDVEDRLRQDLPVRRDDDQVRRLGGDAGHRIRVAGLLGLVHRNPEPHRQLLHGRGTTVCPRPDGRSGLHSTRVTRSVAARAARDGTANRGVPMNTVLRGPGPGGGKVTLASLSQIPWHTTAAHRRCRCFKLFARRNTRRGCRGGDPIDEEDAVQVVDLVLQGPERIPPAWSWSGFPSASSPRTTTVSARHTSPGRRGRSGTPRRPIRSPSLDDLGVDDGHRGDALVHGETSSTMTRFPTPPGARRGRPLRRRTSSRTCRG